jgi:hypothetical protein
MRRCPMLHTIHTMMYQTKQTHGRASWRFQDNAEVVWSLDSINTVPIRVSGDIKGMLLEKRMMNVLKVRSVGQW